MRTYLTAGAGVLAIVAAGIGATYIVLRPTEYRVAIPSSNTIDQRLFSVAARMLRTQRVSTRIQVVASEDGAAALKSLQAGNVDLALVRSDAAMQGGAHTVMIMRREVAVLIAPKEGVLQKATDLPNAKIGVARVGPLDGGLLGDLLDYYGIARGSKTIPVPLDEVASAFRDKKIDALFAVGTVSSKQMTDVVTEAASGANGAIQFIDLKESDAIATRNPALESIEIDQGAFGGRPPRPGESFHTVGYSIRLVATPTISADSIAELIRQLYLVRYSLSAAVPGAGLMEVPDVEEETAFLIHPGVRTYTSGEEKGWMDRYSDWIYLVMFLGSGAGSVAIAIYGMIGGRQSDPMAPVRKFLPILDAVHDAQSGAELEKLERQAEEIFHATFAYSVKGELAANVIASFDMAMREFRSRVAARRQALSTTRDAPAFVATLPRKVSPNG